MVVILNPADYDTWLTGSVEDALRLLQPYPSDQMQIVREGVGILRDEGS